MYMAIYKKKKKKVNCRNKQYETTDSNANSNPFQSQPFPIDFLC